MKSYQIAKRIGILEGAASGFFTWFFSSTSVACLWLGATLVTIGLLLLTLWKVSRGVIDLSSLVTWLLLATTANSYVDSLGDSIGVVGTVLGASKRLFGLLSRNSRVDRSGKRRLQNLRGEIEFRSVRALLFDATGLVSVPFKTGPGSGRRQLQSGEERVRRACGKKWEWQVNSIRAADKAVRA